jgi:hypothetical protein
MGTLLAESPHTILVSNTIGRLANKYPPPEALDTIKIGVQFTQHQSNFFQLEDSS